MDKGFGFDFDSDVYYYEVAVRYYYVNDENKERYNKDDNKVENEVEKRDKEDKR